MAYEALIDSIPARLREPLKAESFDLTAAMEHAYDGHLQTQLLSAAGLNSDLAARLRSEHPELSIRFAALSRRCAR